MILLSKLIGMEVLIKLQVFVQWAKKLDAYERELASDPVPAGWTARVPKPKGHRSSGPTDAPIGGPSPAMSFSKCDFTR